MRLKHKIELLQLELRGKNRLVLELERTVNHQQNKNNKHVDNNRSERKFTTASNQTANTTSTLRTRKYRNWSSANINIFI